LVYPTSGKQDNFEKVGLDFGFLDNPENGKKKKSRDMVKRTGKERRVPASYSGRPGF
jgi:hypothetical protein